MHRISYIYNVAHKLYLRRRVCGRKILKNGLQRCSSAGKDVVEYYYTSTGVMKYAIFNRGVSNTGHNVCQWRLMFFLPSCRQRERDVIAQYYDALEK